MMQDPLSVYEAEKYRRMWSVPEYRSWAPGEDTLDIMRESLAPKPPDLIIDFGCGTGRPALKLAEAGFRVIGIDCAANCLDRTAHDRFSFIEASLWEIPTWVPFGDYGYCTDVMEHIPPNRIDKVLEAIADRSTKGAFFRIDFGEDSMGKRIGETLHLTVREPAWWRERLSRFWRSVEVPARHCFVCKP